MDEDVLLRVRIADVGEQVFLGAGTERIRRAAAHAARACIAVIAGRNPGKVRHRFRRHPLPLRLVAGELVPREDGEARAALDHRRAHVGAFGQHQVHEIGGFLERVGVHLGRCYDRKTARAHPLRVECRHAVLVRRIKTKPLHRHLAGDDALGVVVAANDGEAVAECGCDDRVRTRCDRAVRHALGVALEPEDVRGLRAPVDDLESRAHRLAWVARCGRACRANSTEEKEERDAGEFHESGGGVGVYFAALRTGSRASVCRSHASSLSLSRRTISGCCCDRLSSSPRSLESR